MKIRSRYLIMFLIFSIVISFNSVVYADIQNPTAISTMKDGDDGFSELKGASSITTVVIDGKTYALVASFDDNGVQIINISDPSNPTAIFGITDDNGGFTELLGAKAILL